MRDCSVILDFFFPQVSRAGHEVWKAGALGSRGSSAAEQREGGGALPGQSRGDVDPSRSDCGRIEEALKNCGAAVNKQHAALLLGPGGSLRSRGDEIQLTSAAFLRHSGWG